ncbi:hypothetical protein [Bacillus cereus]|nr:hypothetical protein [Bacillus cereus]
MNEFLHWILEAAIKAVISYITVQALKKNNKKNHPVRRKSGGSKKKKNKK